MQPRPYQAEAIDAAYRHLCEKDSNPCVVLPTGAGKSPVIAWMIQRFKQDHPPFRVIVLAHRKELVRQNAEKMRAVWPDASVGIYAAGLRRRDMGHPITFAAIDSVYKKAYDFDPFDLVIVDEAHRIPAKGEGKYRQFLGDARRANPHVRVVGMTATPYRLTTGNICHRDHILNEVCYDANVKSLIDAGYLCPLRSKLGESRPDLTGVKSRGGDYVTASLAKATEGVVAPAVRELVGFMDREDRKAVIVFCVDVAHCERVSEELATHGVVAPVVTGKTPAAERDALAQGFAGGKYRALCNVNVFTEGFDATRTDGVALMRPTQSRGLYVQMVGRGLRLDDRKADCLVLDFAGCIDEHGPIDLLEGDTTPTEVCAGEGCKEVYSRALDACPACGTDRPVAPTTPPGEGPPAARERKMHGAKPGSKSIISSDEPDVAKVDGVMVAVHRKPGGADSLRVEYRCGLSVYREWVCLDHEGYARNKARGWWRSRFPGDAAPSVEEAAGDMFLPARLNQITTAVHVRRKGRYWQVVGHDLKIGAPAHA